MKKIIEYISDFLSLLLQWMKLILFYTAFLFCVPSFMNMMGFTKIALVCYYIAISLSCILFVYALVRYIIAIKKDETEMVNRCIDIGVTFTGTAIVGTIIAHIIGLL